MREYDETDDPDDRDDFDRRNRGPATFPAGAKAAGIMWIAFGAFGLVAQAVTFATNAGQGSAGGPVCGFLFALIFLMIGLQTVRGTAKTTLANGVGSIVFSMVYFALGVTLATGVFLPVPPNAPPDQAAHARQVMLLIGLVVFAFGGLLFTAGVLAILSNTRYKEWRRAEGLTGSNRRDRDRDRDRDDDDDDRRPRRRRENDRDRYDDHRDD